MNDNFPTIENKASVAACALSVWQDLRHGVVLLRRDARVSSLIVLVLALGIGGNAAVFTLLKAAFLTSLPYPQANQLVTVTSDSGWHPTVSEFVELRSRSRTLADLAFAEYRDMQLSGRGEPARVYAARVSASFFPLLGVGAARGRTFQARDNQPGRAPSILLTDAFWRSRMGGDPEIVGQTVRLDGQAATVLGVLPADFHFDYPTLSIAEPVDIYVPYPFEGAMSSGATAAEAGTPVRVVGRVGHGVKRSQAAAEVRSIGHELAHQYPAVYHDREGRPSDLALNTQSLGDAIVGSQSSLLWLLVGGAGILLLTACANTAQLLLARSLGRAREIAVRSALGASRVRLIRQFLMEGLVLAVCGGAAGLLMAGWMARLLVSVLPTRSPLLETAHSDARVAMFTLGASLISALVFAIIPAIKSSRWAPGSSLNSQAAAGEGSRWRQAMIAIEAALSVFLLCGAGLVVQNLWTLISTPIGFDANHVLAMQVKLPSLRQNGLVDTKAGLAFQQYIDKIEAVPGVDSAAAVVGPPLRPARGGPAELVGVRNADGTLKSVRADIHLVGADYFRTLRIPVLAGRTFDADDALGNSRVAIVNEEFARRFGLGRDIVGKQISEPGDAITIVGVVGNVRTRGLQAAAVPETYLSSLQFSWANAYIVVRSAIPKPELVRLVKGAIESANSEQAVFGVLTMNELLADSQSEPRFNVFLIGAFALLALTMAAAGIYSVIACLVSQRSKEIALRMALGASREAIVRTVLGTTAAWVMAGVVAGVGAGLALRNTVRALSDTAGQGSTWMYAWVAAFFVVVSLAAAYAPLRTAQRIDPAVALRCE